MALKSGRERKALLMPPLCPPALAAPCPCAHPTPPACLPVLPQDEKPHVLPSVVQAEKRVMALPPNKEYSGYGGSASFCRLAAELALGPGNAALAEGRAVSVQTLSGTGALRVGVRRRVETACQRGRCARGCCQACTATRCCLHAQLPALCASLCVY